MSRLTDLHFLVHSLEKGEKRFFRLSQAHLLKEGGQLLTLYKVLLDSPPENPDPLSSAFSFHEIKQNLPTLLRRLRKAIVDSLRLQKGEDSIESRLHRDLEELSILFGKKLYLQAMWTLRKAKALAHDFGHLRQLGMLIHWERKINLELFPKDLTQRIKKLKREETENRTLLGIHEELGHLNYLARALVRRRLRLEDGEERAEFEGISHHPAVEEGLKSGDFLSFMYASSIRGAYFNGVQNYEMATKIYRRAFDRWRENPAWIAEQSSLFISIFNNYQIALMHSQEDLLELEDCLDFIQGIQFRNPALQLRLQDLAYQSGLVMYMNTGRFEEGAQLADEIEGWLELNKRSLSGDVQLTYLYNTCVIHFLSSQFAKARACLILIHSLPGKTARRDIREFARLLELAVVFELEGVAGIEFLFPSTYQYFSRSQLNTFQKYTFSHFRSLFNLLGSDQLTRHFQSYSESLKNLSDSDESLPFGVMEMWTWALARSQRISIQEGFAQLRQILIAD